MFTPAELEAYLDEALAPEVMAKIEEQLKARPDLVQELVAINTRREAGVHSVGGVWRRGLPLLPGQPGRPASPPGRSRRRDEHPPGKIFPDQRGLFAEGSLAWEGEALPSLAESSILTLLENDDPLRHQDDPGTFPICNGGGQHLSPGLGLNDRRRWAALRDFCVRRGHLETSAAMTA
jgi:hypothetical protein